MTNIILIDAMSLVFRSFFAIQDMYNHRKEHIGAVYGFVNQVLNVINSYKAKHVVVALDTKEKTWRHLQYEGYKAQRKQTPPELVPQFGLIREACIAFGIRFYEGNGHEADDWIASCVYNYSQIGKVYVVSTDKDLLQLVSDNVSVYDPFRQVEIDHNGVISKWGVNPDQIVDLLALTGDAVDGITGIKGIGPKTAAKWLNEYKTLENILENAKNLTPNSKREQFLAGAHTLSQAKELITLRKGLEVDLFESTEMKPCGNRIRIFLEQNGLNLKPKANRILGL